MKVNKLRAGGDKE